MKDFGRIYARLLEERTPARVAETPAGGTAHNLDELELQSRWFAGEFGSEFVTTCGRKIRVVQFGVWNREAGPDFVEAAVELEGRPVEGGSIELDLHANGWEQHGHSQNPAFANTRLHVFFHAPRKQFFSRTIENRLVPQVLLDPAELRTARLVENPPATPGRCIPTLAQLSDEHLEALILGAAQIRLRQKGRRLLKIAAIHGADQAIYEGLAETLGYRENKLPFSLLSQRFPLKFLRQKGIPAEALLFGSAGFLGSTDLGAFSGETRTYLRQLWEQWWPHRAACERHMREMPAWKTGGVRPANHPQRRLAALALLAANWPRITRYLEDHQPRAIYKFLSGLEHPYWSTHYTLNSKPAKRKMALIGESRVAEMLSNVIYPWFLAQKPSLWEDFTKLRAKQRHGKLDVILARLFGEDPVRGEPFTKTLAGQQGLLAIYEDFCRRDISGCTQCPFPEQVATHFEDDQHPH